jgi:ABC transporter with metal-binding/Fe-S-binding domain ATP-binding protein
VRICALYSGGKDSTYALHWAVLKGFEVPCLLTLRPRRSDSWMFHYPNIGFTEYQARSMGIPRVLWETNGERDLELMDLRNALNYIKNEYGIIGIVTGALLSDYQRMRINIVARELGLRVYSPLWRKDQVRYLREVYRYGFRFMLTSISVYGIPPSMLGHVLDEDDIEELIRLANKYGFNPALEGGEGETFVLDAPLFKYRVEVTDGEVVRQGPHEWIYVIKSAQLVPKPNAIG